MGRKLWKGRVISGVSTFKEPLRSQRKKCVYVCVCVFLVIQAVQSTVLSLRMMVLEGRSLRRRERWIKKGVKSYRMGEGRQVARQGSPAQLPLVCGLVFTAMDRSGGRRRKADLACSANRKEVKEPCPFQLSLGARRLLSLWDSEHYVLYGVGGKGTDQASDHAWV